MVPYSLHNRSCGTSNGPQNDIGDCLGLCSRGCIVVGVRVEDLLGAQGFGFGTSGVGSGEFTAGCAFL